MYMFFFKQKTAYEMRISDWSSDVCSSDLQGNRAMQDKNIPGDALGTPVDFTPPPPARVDLAGRYVLLEPLDLARHQAGLTPLALDAAAEIGRASCRERVCQYV